MVTLLAGVALVLVTPTIAVAQEPILSLYEQLA
jgi:hypothetical protein